MALADTIEVLARAPLLELFDRDALRLIAFSAETLRFRPGEVLFRQGERSDGGYVVMEGEFGLSRGGFDHVTIAGPGALIGELAMFVRLERPATATARAPSRAVRISPTLMRRALEEFPSAAAAIRDAIAAELGELTEGLERVRHLLLSVDDPKRRDV